MNESIVVSIASDDENGGDIGHEFHAFRPISRAFELSPAKSSKYFPKASKYFEKILIMNLFV